MHLLHFVSAFFPSTGGTVTRLHNLFSSDAHTHDFFILKPPPAHSSGAPIAPTQSFDNITLHRPPPNPHPSPLNRLPWRKPLIAARTLVDAAQSTTPDLLYGHNPLACALASLDLHRRRLDLPFIYEAHGIMREFSNFPALGPLTPLLAPPVRALLARHEARVLAAADRIIAQTETARRKLIAYYRIPEHRIITIYNGVDPVRFDPARHESDRTRLRAELRCTDRTVCLYAGYLDRVNGIDFLLDAIHKLSPDARRRLLFLLIGDGPRAPRLREFARAHADILQYLGPRPYDEMPACYAAADVFLIPRPPSPPAETFLPMKLLEAMSMQKLILVSDVAAMADVVRHNENGLLFRKGDTHDFLNRLNEIQSQPAAHAALGAAARQDVVARYAWSASRARLADLFKEISKPR